MIKQVSRAVHFLLPVCFFALLAIAAHSASAQSTSAAHSTGTQHPLNPPAAAKPNTPALEKHKDRALNKTEEDSSVQFLMGDILIEKGSLDEYFSATKSNR